MARLRRIRKLLYGALGFAASYAVLLPPTAPGKVREGAAVVIALATLVGVYKARNDGPPQVAPTLFAHQPQPKRPDPGRPERQRPVE